MKNNLIIFIIFSPLLATSCDPVTEIKVSNNTENKILIEYTTIYNSQFYKTEMIDGRLMGYINHSHGGYFVVFSDPLVLNPGEAFSIIRGVGTDIIRYMGFGTIESIDDVVSAIDQIFTDINVYTFYDGTKTLLYDKNYFLNTTNIKIKRWMVNIEVRPRNGA